LNTYVVLLRGINVGGRNKLPMKALVALCQDLGCQNVKTYIQSGNVVLQCEKTAESLLTKSLTAAIKKQHGFAPHVMMLGRAELDRAMKANPFPDAESEPATLHACFLDATPKKPDSGEVGKAQEGHRALQTERPRLLPPRTRRNRAFQTRCRYRARNRRPRHKPQLANPVQD
jgi:uncharacterized protein (DUF1697 family)